MLCYICLEYWYVVGVAVKDYVSTVAVTQPCNYTSCTSVHTTTLTTTRSVVPPAVVQCVPKCNSATMWDTQTTPLVQYAPTTNNTLWQHHLSSIGSVYEL